MSLASQVPELAILGRTIQSAVAPVFLLVATGNLINVMTGRLARVVDRSRALEERYAATQGAEHSRVVWELRRLDRRMSLVNTAIGMAVACGVVVCLMVAGLFLGEVAGFPDGRGRGAVVRGRDGPADRIAGAVPGRGAPGHRHHPRARRTAGTRPALTTREGSCRRRSGTRRSARASAPRSWRASPTRCPRRVTGALAPPMSVRTQPGCSMASVRPVSRQSIDSDRPGRVQRRLGRAIGDRTAANCLRDRAHAGW